MACVRHPGREAVARCVACGDELCEECRQVGPDGKSYCAEHLSEAGEETEASMPPRGEAEAAGATASPDSPGLAAACYFSWIATPLSFLLPVIPLASNRMKRSSYMRYHAINGLFWGLAVVVVMAALHIAVSFGGALRVLGLLMAPLRLARALAGVAALVASIVLAVRAYNRENVRIPLVSDLTDQQMR